MMMMMMMKKVIPEAGMLFPCLLDLKGGFEGGTKFLVGNLPGGQILFANLFIPVIIWKTSLRSYW